MKDTVTQLDKTLLTKVEETTEIQEFFFLSKLKLLDDS